MVPGSMLMYGSSFRMETGTPRALRMRPIEAAVMPLPRELVTPPVTKTYLGIVPNLSPVDSSVRSGHGAGHLRSTRERGTSTPARDASLLHRPDRCRAPGSVQARLGV